MARRIRAGDADEWQGLLDEFKDADDRSAGILAGEAVDVQLCAALKSLCGPGVPKEVRDAFLDSNFNDRSVAACALGIVSSETYGSLCAIRKIKNAFAHGPRGLKFGAPGIAERATALPIPNDPAILPQVRRDWSKLDPRYKYLLACTAVIHAIEARVGHRRVRPPTREF